MKHEVLSYSFVGVWVNPLPGVPRLAPQMLMDLLDDKYTTNVGLAPDGSLMVHKLGKPPTPTVVFGTTRVQVQCPSLDQTAKVLGRVMQEAYDRAQQQIPLVAQIGLNTEHEWIKPGFSPSSRWLADQYVRKGLFDPPDGTIAEATSINFKLTTPGRVYNIQLQPRAENQSGIFAHVNDHREWHKPVPSSDELTTLLSGSVAEIEAKVAPLILGGVADA